MMKLILIFFPYNLVVQFTDFGNLVVQFTDLNPDKKGFSCAVHRPDRGLVV